MPLKVQSFTLKDLEVDIMYNKGHLAYTFMKDGKSYGIKLKLEKRTVENIVACTFQLLTHALGSFEALKQENENTRLSTGVKKAG